MRTATASLTILSTGDIAGRFGVTSPEVRRVIDRLGIGKRIGQYRVVHADDLETVEIALRAAGIIGPIDNRESAAAPKNGKSKRS